MASPNVPIPPLRQQPEQIRPPVRGGDCPTRPPSGQRSPPRSPGRGSWSRAATSATAAVSGPSRSSTPSPAPGPPGRHCRSPSTTRWPPRSTVWSTCSVDTSATAPRAPRRSGCPRPGRWESVADMPEARGAGTSAVLGTSIFVAGGIGPGKDVLAGSMLVYDSVTDRGGPRPDRRRGANTSAARRGRTVLHRRRPHRGGQPGHGRVLRPGHGAWTRRPDLPTARGGLAATGTCHGWVIAAGGEGKATFPQVELFEPAADRWRALPQCPTRGTASRW